MRPPDSSPDQAIPLAASIFLDVLNIFLFFLQIFWTDARPRRPPGLTDPTGERTELVEGTVRADAVSAGARGLTPEGISNLPSCKSL
jgi:hypothetical protein